MRRRQGARHLELRNKYKPHEAKRQLCDAHDLFLADERVLPKLPALLGKTFFKKRRQPIPIDATKADLGAQIRKAAASTYAHAGAGTCLHVKVGTPSMSAKHITENAIAAIEGLVASSCVPRGWANVQAVFMKTNASAALPLYAAMPDPNEDRAAREEKAAKDARKAERNEAKNASGGR